MRDDPDQDDPPLPDDLRAALAARGLLTGGEVRLRRALEQRLPGYSLYRLPPAARRRWKAHYRLMTDATYFDGQTPAEVYARALLAVTDPGADLGPDDAMTRLSK